MAFFFSSAYINAQPRHSTAFLRFLIACLTVIWLFFPLDSTFAQSNQRIEGIVVDAQSGESLPSAAVYLDQSFRGTVTNAEGKFTLKVDTLPVTLVVQFLGYQSYRQVLNELPKEALSIKLQAESLELQEIVVTDEDPGVKIMREVIRRKKIWQEDLNTYKAEGYSRNSLANDTAIAVITETVTDLFWDKERGRREVIKSRKQTSNFMGSANMGGLRFIPNFYDDNIEIAGFDLFTPTHPDAIANYVFKLVGQTALDGKAVFEIEVTPKKELQPLFIGTVWVLEEEYALIKVALKPNEVVRFPMPIKEMTFNFEQQFSNFGSEFWLPLDYRSNGKLKIKMVGLEFPLFRFAENARITGYEVNVALPDSLFEEDEFTAIIDSVSIKEPDSLYFERIDAIPLSQEEATAYAELDSSKSISKAFKPKGFLAKQFDIELEVEGETANPDSVDKANQGIIRKGINLITPKPSYNRVDGLYLGVEPSIKVSDRLRLTPFGGYSLALEEASFGGSASWQAFESRRTRIIGGFERRTFSRYQSYFTGNTSNSLLVGVYGTEDYFDWYRADRAQLGLQHRIKGLGLLKSYFQIEEGRSVATQNSYDIVGEKRPQPFNPLVAEDRIQSLVVEWKIGEGPENMQVFGANGAHFKAEWSDEFMGSKVGFGRLQGQFNLSIPTFYKRRFMPNKLDIIGFAAVHLGDELPQRQNILETSQFAFTQFGAFRTHIGRPMAGSNVAWLHAEHNFQTVPFELLGLDFLVKRDIGLLLFAGSGVVGGQDFSALGLGQLTSPENFRGTQTEWIHEVGVSVNKLFGIFRGNIGLALPQNEWVASISVAKFF